MTVELVVPLAAAGMRLDVFLAGYCEAIPSRAAAQRLVKDGRVTMKGVKGAVSPCGVWGSAPRSYRICAEDIIRCEIPEPETVAANAEDIPLHIVYEDEDVVVVDKPRGLVVHPAAGHSGGTLVNALLWHCELSGVGGALRPGIVHRLDKDTSGLMVAAKNDAVHVELAAQLERREMGRVYQAVCVGHIKKNVRIDLPIGRHPRDRKKMAVIPPYEKARKRHAITHIEVIRQLGNFTLVKARLETGRTHQIRVHLAHIGHPVLGDTVYGAARQPFGLEGQVLHAAELRFIHPTSGESMSFTSPLPEYFQDALRNIGE